MSIGARNMSKDTNQAPSTAREREAAMQEILQVISNSRDDTAPVFDVILRSVQRLCNVPLVFLPIADEERTRVTVPASIGARPEFAAVLKNFDEPLARSELVAVRAIRRGQRGARARLRR